MTGDPCGGNVPGGAGCKCAPPFGTAQHATAEQQLRAAISRALDAWSRNCDCECRACDQLVDECDTVLDREVQR